MRVVRLTPVKLSFSTLVVAAAILIESAVICAAARHAAHAAAKHCARVEAAAACGLIVKAAISLEHAIAVT